MSKKDDAYDPYNHVHDAVAGDPDDKRCLPCISIYDKVARTFSPPVVADSREAALRDFGRLLRDDKTLVGQHPADYELYIVGWWLPGAGHIDECGGDGYEWLASGAAILRESGHA